MTFISRDFIIRKTEITTNCTPIFKNKSNNLHYLAAYLRATRFYLQLLFVYHKHYVKLFRYLRHDLFNFLNLLSRGPPLTILVDLDQ